MLLPETTKKLSGGYFCQGKPPPPSENLSYISYFSHTTVCKFQIEPEREKNPGAQDQLPSPSLLRHVLCQTPERTQLPVGFNHLIFRPLLLPLDLRS